MSLEHVLHDVSYGSELLAYFVTVFYFNKTKSRTAFLLLVLMSIVFITETLGKFKPWFSPDVNIFLIQNVEMLCEVSLFLLVYYCSVTTPTLKKWIGVMLLSFAAFAVVSALWLQPLQSTFPTLSIVAGGSFILITILIYFYEILQKVPYQNLYQSPMFYISIGLFIFYANEMPVMTLLNYFVEHDAAIDKVYLLIDLKLIVSILFYLLYSFGILWTTKK
jgi:hypothetical protein